MIVLSAIYIMLNGEKNIKIENYLQKHSKNYATLYEMHYHQYKEKSHIIFDTLINTPEVLQIYKQIQNASESKKNTLRDELYQLLGEKYEGLRYIKLRQLHFHLQDNESFLRFHKPQKYGDNLSNVRETITYVNKYKKPIDSFEEGRIYSGYRFVFPLKDGTENHLGSVEVSFNMSVFTFEFMTHFKVLSNFHIKSSVVEKKVWGENRREFYKKSPFDGYYMDKTILKERSKFTKLQQGQLQPNPEVLEKMKKIIDSNKLDTVYLESMKQVITIIPIENSVTGEVVAFMTIRGDGTYISDVIRNFYFLLLTVVVFLSVIFFLMYRKLRTQEKANELLRERVAIEVEKNRIKDLELLEHHKMVSMGEMIANIAHQWRQPLGAISCTAGSIKIKNELGTLDNKSLVDNVDDILETTQYLSEIIDVFRNYMREDTEAEEYIIAEIIDESLHIVFDSLSSKSVEIKKEYDLKRDITAFLISGELSQVIINLINNARDALLSTNLEEKWIKISLDSTQTDAIICIEDNGGGIDKDIIDKVFEPYFTTKHKSVGTGLGLSMSYKIVTQSIHGKIYVKNTENGAKFFIEIPLD